MPKRSPIRVAPGVEPTPDNTNKNTIHWTDADGVRFDRDGRLQELDDYTAITYNDSASVSGCSRSVYNYYVANGNLSYSVIGTHQKLYALLGNVLTNITPLSTTTTAIANSLDNHYDTLSSAPVATVDGSTTVTITDTATLLQAGDSVTLSGATATNGVPAGDINTTHTVVAVPTANTFTIIVSTAATSTGSGGGASVARASGILTVNATAHAQSDGDRVKLASATAVGGIDAVEINKEFIIRNSQTNTFEVVTDDVATSSVTGGGGASTTYQKEIDDGQCDSSPGYGAGMGLAGAGLAGTGRAGTNPISPRIWSFGIYGTLLVLTPGGQTGAYSWDGDTSEAPALITNAPTAINWLYVTNNILVTLGDSDVGERRKWSGQSGLTTWTTAANNKAGEDDIEGATKFISQIQVSGEDLLFTKNQVWVDQYTTSTLVFRNRQLTDDDGLVGPNARVVHDGVAYWMGNRNFYRYYGGRPEIIPKCTLRDYVYNRLNETQKEKCWAEVRTEYGEVWFWYPSTESTEIDSYVIFNPQTGTWTPGGMVRTAVAKGIKYDAPRLIDSSGALYLHEQGDDSGTNDITVTIYTRYDKRGATERTFGPKTVSSTDTRVYFRAKGNMRKYRLEGTGAGGNTWYVESNWAMIGEGDDTYTILYTYPDSVQASNPFQMGRWIEEIALEGAR